MNSSGGSRNKRWEMAAYQKDKKRKSRIMPENTFFTEDEIYRRKTSFFTLTKHSIVDREQGGWGW